VEVVLLREQLKMAKESLHGRLNQFNTVVRGRIGKSVFARMLPVVPGLGDGYELFTRPLVRAVQVWTKVNAAPPPSLGGDLVLQDGGSLAVFSADVDGLLDLYRALTRLEEAFSLVMEERNAIQAVLYRWMKEYRRAVPSRFAAGSAHVDSMPLLSPDYSRTPDAVSAEGEWVAAQSAAQITATVSDERDLKEYELRWCAGGEYSTEKEHVAGSIPGGSPPIFLTTKGLTGSGHTACFRVYVRLHDGGEAGSNTVVVSKP